MVLANIAGVKRNEELGVLLAVVYMMSRLELLDSLASSFQLPLDCLSWMFVAIVPTVKMPRTLSSLSQG